MKRNDLMKHLRRNGCEVLRDQGKHTVVWNPRNGQVSCMPRHNEINEYTARGICKQLGIATP